MRLSPELVLHAPGLVLRPWQTDDAAALHTAVQASMPELSAMFDWCHSNYGLADAEAWIRFSQQAWAAGSEYPFALLTEAGDLLGSVGLNQINRAHRFANLGYWVRSSERGRGWTGRASALLSQHVFANLPISRIEIVTLPENRASQRVAEKLGARLECEARNRLVVRGVSRAAYLYSLTPDDLSPQTPTAA